MTHPKKKIELPLIEPLYSTYHYEGPGTAILASNPSVANWYLGHAALLTCDRKFLTGYTSPEIGVLQTSYGSNPHLEQISYKMQYLKGYVHYVIRNLIDHGYYVCFSGIDDYYVEGKGWYHERHFYHDGCICGYDQENKTYCIYAYDKNWIYQKFWTPQKAFERGRQVAFKNNTFGFICGIKPKEEQVSFEPEVALRKIKEYLNSTMEQYPEDEDGPVRGIVVHDYIAKYLDMLYDHAIPYEKMDRRVFRVIWEHKKVMQKRIELIETAHGWDHSVSEAYQSVISVADHCRILYAAHHMKQRDSLLPVIKRHLLTLKEQEQEILNRFLEKQKGEEKE